MRYRSGFTLLELLVAAVIMVVVLTALSGLFASSIRANQANTKASEGQQNAEAAIQLLENEIGLAGYRGTDAGAVSRDFVVSPSFPTVPASTLTVTADTSTRDRVSARFFEDRYLSCPSGQTYCPIERSVTFGVNTSTKELTRQQDGGNNMAVVEGVTNLKVTSYLYLNNGKVEPLATMPADKATLRGITVQLTFVDATSRSVAIALSNAQK